MLKMIWILVEIDIKIIETLVDNSMIEFNFLFSSIGVLVGGTQIVKRV